MEGHSKVLLFNDAAMVINHPYNRRLPIGGSIPETALIQKGFECLNLLNCMYQHSVQFFDLSLQVIDLICFLPETTG